jgi:hypothetical protein
MGVSFIWNKMTESAIDLSLTSTFWKKAIVLNGNLNIWVLKTFVTLLPSVKL